MNDIQMTFLCAEALRDDDKSINISVDANGEVWNQWDDGSWAQLPKKFDPLHDNWYALSLMKKLELCCAWQPSIERWWVHPIGGKPESYAQDLNRAIVECVAHMQSAR